MERPEPTLEDRREFACDCLETRLRILEDDRATASPERLRQIDEEQDAIKTRLYEIQSGWGMEAEDFGKRLPCVERRRSVRTSDGYRIESIDSGSEYVVRCWRETDPGDSIEITAAAGRFMPFPSAPISMLEDSVYSLLSGGDRKRRTRRAHG